MTSKTALIIGGGSGMGAAAARKLAAEGFNVAILSSSGKGEALAKELGGLGFTGSNLNVDDLKRWGGQWKPDYAILYQMSLSIGSIAKHVLGRPAQVAPAKTSDVNEGPITWINRLVEKTTIYANVKGQITARIGASRVLANGLGLQAEQEFTAMLRDFIGAAQSIGSVPVLTTFATSHTRHDTPLLARRFDRRGSPQGRTNRSPSQMPGIRIDRTDDEWTALPWADQ